MSKNLARWSARAIVAGCLIVGAVVLGNSTSAAGSTTPPPTPAPITATQDGTIWITG
jgi:hypothetical protein